MSELALSGSYYGHHKCFTLSVRGSSLDKNIWKLLTLHQP